MTTALIVLAAIAVGAVVVVGVVVVTRLILAHALPDLVDHAYESLPAGRPELRIDTVTGSHDRYPQMTDNTRDIVTAYCEAMWRESANGDKK